MAATTSDPTRDVIGQKKIYDVAFLQFFGEFHLHLCCLHLLPYDVMSTRGLTWNVSVDLHYICILWLGWWRWRFCCWKSKRIHKKIHNMNLVEKWNPCVLYIHLKMTLTLLTFIVWDFYLQKRNKVQFTLEDWNYTSLKIQLTSQKTCARRLLWETIVYRANMHTSQI